MNRHNDRGKWMVLKVARENMRMTLCELGESVGDMDYAAVCMGVRRFDLRLKQQDKGGKWNENDKRILEMLYV